MISKPISPVTSTSPAFQADKVIVTHEIDSGGRVDTSKEAKLKEAASFLDSYLRRKRDQAPAVERIKGSEYLTRAWRRQLAKGVSTMIEHDQHPSHYLVVRMPLWISRQSFLACIESYLQPVYAAANLRLHWVASFDADYEAAHEASCRGRQVAHPAGLHVDLLLHLPPEVENRVYKELAKLNAYLKKTIGQSDEWSSIIAPNTNSPVHIQPITSSKRRGGQSGLVGTCNYVSRHYSAQAKRLFMMVQSGNHTADELSPVIVSQSLEYGLLAPSTHAGVDLTIQRGWSIKMASPIPMDITEHGCPGIIEDAHGSRGLEPSRSSLCQVYTSDGAQSSERRRHEHGHDIDRTYSDRRHANAVPRWESVLGSTAVHCRASCEGCWTRRSGGLGCSREPDGSCLRAGRRSHRCAQPVEGWRAPLRHRGGGGVNILPFRPAATPPAPPLTVELILKPVPGSPGRFDAVDDTGRVVVRSRQPLYDGARALLAAGTVPDTILQTRHQGSPHIAMRGVLAELARWAVSDGDRSGLQRRPWQPFSGIGADSPATPSQAPQDGRQGIACIETAREARRAPERLRTPLATISRRRAA